MKKNKVGARVLEENSFLDVSSLIDVCFLLLIYFMVAATIQATEQDVSLRTGSHYCEPSTSLHDALSITLHASGEVYLGVAESKELIESASDERSLPHLSQRLEMHKDAAHLMGEVPMVKMTVSDDASQQRLLDILNCLSKQNIKAVTFTDSFTH